MGKKQRKQQTAVSSLPSNARSFELKLARAHDHLQDAHKQVQGWLDACLSSLREEPDPEEAGYYRAWITAPDIDLQLLSLRIGEGLQCLRSALDHLAFELATVFTSSLPDDIEKDSEWPIFGDAEGKGQARFHQLRSKGGLAGQPAPGSGVAKIRGIDPKAQAIIEGLQPYHRGHAYVLDPLWRLQELNRLDKHRLLHVVARIMEGATMPVAGPRLPKARWPRNVAALGRADGQPFILDIRGGTAPKGRTLVARWPMLPIDPRKKMHMGFRPVLNVIFDAATPLVGNTPVPDVLREVEKHVTSRVIPPLVGFLQ